jgi:hypothetical protein
MPSTNRLKLTRTYWNMRSRCEKPTHRAYPWYGGRGIKCLWSSFQDFYEDMAPALEKATKSFPGERLSLERINVEKDYTKDNCKWIPLRWQSTNRRGGLSSKSGLKGVSPQTRNGRKWQARIMFNEKAIALGTFNTKKEAAIAYDLGALKYFGVHAWLNFPKESLRLAKINGNT